MKEVGNKSKIEKRIFPHLFRELIGRFLHENGMTKEKLKVFYGHKNMSTTEIYLQKSIIDIEKDYREALEKVSEKFKEVM